MTVVVGGQARKAGKTTAMCDIIGATRQLEWVAVKLTAHSHRGKESGGLPDTERYLRAGARESLLLHDASQLPRALNMIVESNAAVEQIQVDLFVFITDGSNPEWKESARRVWERARIVADRKIPEHVLTELARTLLRVANEQKVHSSWNADRF